ncbi:MAG: AI-2E family transporter [Planctomycetes bacterium]|nr:AI-2E family transporter [Planctomycetota bacterium]
MDAAPRPETLWQRRRTDVLIALGTVALLVVAIVFRAVLSPLALAVAVAYILNPIMRWAERHRVPRAFSATLLFLVLIVACVVVALFAVPPLVSQLYEFGVNVVGEPEAEAAPGYTDLNGNGQWDRGYVPALLAWVKDMAARLQTGESTWYDRMLAGIGDSAGGEAGVLNAALGALKQAGQGFLGFLWGLQGFVVGLALAAFYLFFFLMSFDRMVDAVRVRLPGKYRTRVEGVALKIDAAISAFLRGRIVVCAIIGVLTAVGLALLGVPYWFLIGVVTGLAGVVPYLPIFVGLAPAILAAWFGGHGGWTVAGVAGVFVLVQTLEGWVLTPLIQGKAVGLHPVTLTVALLVGYQVLGFVGLVAAVPLAATVKILAREFILPKVDELAEESPKGAGPAGPAGPAARSRGDADGGGGA